jgi:epoxyqueuosine reductase
MITARGVEVESADLRLPGKPAGHPSVQAVLARRAAGDVASPPAVIDAAWLREPCLAAGGIGLPSDCREARV